MEAGPISAHSPDALRDAREIGEARKDAALIRTEQRNQVTVWRFQRGLLARMLQVGSASTDDLESDLRKTFARNSANWRGAAVRRLVTDRIIKAAGFTRCKRASRHGSPLVLWEPVDVEAAKERLAYLDRLIEAFAAAGAGANPSPHPGSAGPMQDTGGANLKNSAKSRVEADSEGNSVQAPATIRRTQPQLPGVSSAGDLWEIEPTLPSRKRGQ